MSANHHNHATSKPARGVLGRGPLFWGALTLILTVAVVAMGETRAIEGTPALLLLLLPITTFGAMMRSAYLLASSEQSSGDGSDCIAKGAAQQRYIKRVAIFTSLYLAGFAAITLFEREWAAPQFVQVLTALVPGLAIIGVFWAIARLIVEETDEFMRMLVIRQALIASGFAMSLASVWGFLEYADLALHLDAFWWAGAWFVGLFLGAILNRIQYGTWGAV